MNQRFNGYAIIQGLAKTYNSTKQSKENQAYWSKFEESMSPKGTVLRECIRMMTEVMREAGIQGGGHQSSRRRAAGRNGEGQESIGRVPLPQQTQVCSTKKKGGIRQE